MNRKNSHVYIDGANVFYTQRKLGWSLDWSKVKKLISESFNAIEWKYYVAVKDGDDKMLKYIKYLNHLGFKVITKPLKKIKLNDEEKALAESRDGYIYKANFDVEMTADILLDSDNADEIILFSGDSDFHYLVERLKQKDVKTIIYASRKTIAWELKLAGSRVVYLEDLKEKISRETP